MLTKSKTLFVKGALLLALSSLLLSHDAFAQGGRAKKDDNPPPNQIDQKTGETMTKAIEFLNTNKPKEARAKLGELKMDRLSPYEKSRVEQLLFSLDIQEENYDGARAHMEAAIASGGFNDQEVSAGRYQLAQLWMQQQKWKEGAAAIEEWLKTATAPNGGVYYLLAAAYYNLEKYDAALPHARKAVEMTDMPQEGWLTMLSALLIQKEQFKDALPVIKRLLNMFPTKKVYWMQLSSVYAQLEDMKNALIVTQGANQAGLLTEGSELQRLADLMSVQNMPYSAAEVLTKAIDDKKITADQKGLEGLADKWIAAREFRKAMPVLEKASAMADNGNNWSRLGEVNFQVFDWDGAATAFEKGVNKGGLKDTGYTELMLGIALYNQNKYAEAKKWFERAASSPKQSKNARGFIQVIDSKLR